MTSFDKLFLAGAVKPKPPQFPPKTPEQRLADGKKQIAKARKSRKAAPDLNFKSAGAVRVR